MFSPLVRWTAPAAIACVASLLASNSSAHILLTSPPPRTPGGANNEGQKTAPCGAMGSMRGDGEVSVFEPGETIMVTWDETVSHDSYYRIAFQADGEDFPVRTDLEAGDRVPRAGDDPEAIHPIGTDSTSGAEVLVYVDDQDGSPASYSAEVTLPELECETCTLQLIQFMYSHPGQYYYQCADIALRGGDGGGMGGMGAGGMGMGGTATGGTGGGGMPSGGMTGVGGVAGTAGGGMTAGGSDGMTGGAGSSGVNGGSSGGFATGGVANTSGAGGMNTTVAGTAGSSVGTAAAAGNHAVGGATGMTPNAEGVFPGQEAGCACAAAGSSRFGGFGYGLFALSAGVFVVLRRRKR